MHLTKCEQAIMRTISYFDLFDYPLTATEVWKWLYKPDCSPEEMSLSHIASILEESPRLKQYIVRSEAFYHIRSKDNLVLQRKERNNRVDEQMRKVIRIVKLLRFFPPIRMVAIASSLTFGNVRDDSDIDLFIVARRGQIWLARFCAVGLLKCLHQRPDATTRKDRFCLTFFIDEDALNIERGSFGQDDIVFQYYAQSFMPVYDPDGLYEKFFYENQWWKRALPNAYTPQHTAFEVVCPPWLRLLHRFVEVVSWPVFHGPWGDWHKRLQMRILPSTLKSIANVDPRVVISDTMLKFHTRDNRKEVLKKWQECMKIYD